MKNHRQKNVKNGNQPVSREHADQVSVDDLIVITIKRLGINGEGVGYYKRKAVFIDGVLPGEVVRARITRVDERHLQAAVERVEKRSPARVQPSCEAFAEQECGGCQLWHLAEHAQLLEKTELVREAFRRYVGEPLPEIRPMLGMEQPAGYRNKAQFQLGYDESGRVVAGLYRRNSHRLVDLVGNVDVYDAGDANGGCRVQPATLNVLIKRVAAVIEQFRIPVDDARQKQRGLRTIVVREGADGVLQLTFVTSDQRMGAVSVEPLLDVLGLEFPKLRSVALNYHDGDSPLVFGMRTEIIRGAETIEMNLGTLKFHLSPRSFFQLNTQQTVKLYDGVKQAAQLTGTELVVDAYCGTGTIGLWLADRAREVRGIETLNEAVFDARANAKLNGIENARFFVGHAEDLLPHWVKQGLIPDVVVVDPPRTGCERSLLKAVIRSQCKRLVYVSCNPSTLAKDCKFLLDNGMKIEYVQPVDMFPYTAHVECIGLMTRQ